MEAVDEWVRTCLGKKKLKEEWADDIILRAKIPMRKYSCPHCFSWHVTKQVYKKK